MVAQYALLVTHRVNSNNMVDSKVFLVRRIISRYNRIIFLISKGKKYMTIKKVINAGLFLTCLVMCLSGCGKTD